DVEGARPDERAGQDPDGATVDRRERVVTDAGDLVHHRETVLVAAAHAAEDGDRALDLRAVEHGVALREDRVPAERVERVDADRLGGSAAGRCGEHRGGDEQRGAAAGQPRAGATVETHDHARESPCTDVRRRTETARRTTAPACTSNVQKPNAIR